MNITPNLSATPIKREWSFAGKTISDTAYITHGIYTYPAKFIPQLASRLISEHSKEDDIVIDSFMGSGTTVLEAIVNKRIGIGTDINEIATLLAKVKTTPIDRYSLVTEYSNLVDGLKNKLNGSMQTELAIAKNKINLPERVDYWFKPHIKDKLLVMLNSIMQIQDEDIKDVFLIVFAQILKSCSIWTQKSVKPLRDYDKKEIDPLHKFEWQAKRVLKKYHDLDNVLSAEVKAHIDDYRVVKNGDSKNLPCDDATATLVVTSPPYVTSYEYADLHQLPSLWFGFLSELAEFRTKFTGSSFRVRESIDLKSKIADNIVKQLGGNKKSREVENYYADMLESFVEMGRVLKKGGKAAVVIGNTTLQGVEILNAEVFQQQFENIGFKTFDIIHREIPSKMLPSTRNPETGKFTKASNSNKLLVYPTEYILIMEKMR